MGRLFILFYGALSARGHHAEGGLYNLGTMLSLATQRGGAYVIDIRGEGDATTIQHAQRDLKNNNELKQERGQSRYSK